MLQKHMNMIAVVMAPRNHHWPTTTLVWQDKHDKQDGAHIQHSFYQDFYNRHGNQKQPIDRKVV